MELLLGGNNCGCLRDSNSEICSPTLQGTSLEEADKRDWDVGVEVEDGVVSSGVLLLVLVAPMAWARVSSSLPSLSEISFPDPSFALQ